MDVNLSAAPPQSTMEASPLEQLKAKIQAAENEFRSALAAEFEALYSRACTLEDDMADAQFMRDSPPLTKALRKAVQGLAEIEAILRDENN